MTRHTSRRALLQRAAMLTAVPVAAAGAVPLFDMVGEPETVQADTPVMEIYRRWKAYRDWLNGPATRDMPEDEYDRLVDGLRPLEDEMERTPARTMTDVAAKVLCLTSNGEGALEGSGQSGFIAECKAILAQV